MSRGKIVVLLSTILLAMLIGFALVVTILHKQSTVIEETTRYVDEEPTTMNIDDVSIVSGNEDKTVGEIKYSANLNDYIDLARFEEAMGQYENVVVLSYGGGFDGVFVVTISTDTGEYTGVWDDPNGVWYESKDDYKGDVDAN